MDNSKYSINELKRKPAIAKIYSVLDNITCLTAVDRGKLPRPSRDPEKGKKGELWFRNSLFSLGTIPLQDKKSFIITHVEAAAYPCNESKVSADLLGLWHSKDSTKFCVAELKAGRNGDNVIYALAEGFRNLWLHKSEKGLTRLRSGWKYDIEKRKAILNAWGAGNPFMGAKGRLKKQCLLVIGDESWISAQENYKDLARNTIKRIEEKFKISVEIHSLNKKAKAGSKPYMLLPLTQWL